MAITDFLVVAGLIFLLYYLTRRSLSIMREDSLVLRELLDLSLQDVEDDRDWEWRYELFFNSEPQLMRKLLMFWLPVRSFYPPELFGVEDPAHIPLDLNRFKDFEK